MVYGDLQFFDIIIFAGIAAFLVFRLKNVLGKRTGFEKPKEQEINSKTSETQNIVEKSSPELQENLSKLKIAYQAIGDFDHNNFLSGAKSAFETIINAFNKGDKKTLRNLVTPEVYSSFEEAINSNQTSPEYQFFSLNIDNIEDVKIEEQKIKICVKFVSEQFKNNDENTIVKKQDVWTFEKKIDSKDPNWLLSST